MNAYRLAEIHPGLSHSFQASISTCMLDQFRELCGDANPLHTELDFALARGYRDRVVYGLLTASFYSTLVGMYLPGRNALLQGVDVSFSSPVFPGDTLTVFGEVVSVHEVFRQIEVRAKITNQLSAVVSRAKIRTGIHE